MLRAALAAAARCKVEDEDEVRGQRGAKHKEPPAEDREQRADACKRRKFRRAAPRRGAIEHVILVEEEKVVEEEVVAAGDAAARDAAMTPSPCSGRSLYGRSPDALPVDPPRRRGSDATDSLYSAEATRAVASRATSRSADRDPRANLIRAIGDALETVASLNDSFCEDLSGEEDTLLAFRGSQRPSFLFRDYLARLVHYLTAWKHEQSGKCWSDKLSTCQAADASEACGDVCDVGIRSLLIALIYTDRLHQMYPRARISTYNMHRIILAGMLLAVKFTEDRRLSNRFWAQVGGLELAELNHLEFQLCALLKFDLFIHPDEYEGCSTMMSKLSAH